MNCFNKVIGVRILGPDFIESLQTFHPSSFVLCRHKASGQHQSQQPHLKYVQSDTVHGTNQWLRFQHGYGSNLHWLQLFMTWELILSLLCLSKRQRLCISSMSLPLEYEPRPKCVPSPSKPRMNVILLHYIVFC